MKITTFFKRLLIGTAAFLITTLAIAGTQPKFSLIPTTATTLSIYLHTSATVQYRVTNNTTITRTLTIVPIQGISPNTAPGNCSIPFTLAHGQSCLLTLTLNGNQLAPRTVGGPVVCKTESPSNNSPSPFLCSQPSAADSLNITVPISLNSIIITPANPAIVSGTTQQFTATGIYADATTQDITNAVTWSSSSADATISSTGLATGSAHSGGSAVISASLNGVTGSTTLTVLPATLVSIAVTPTNALIDKGDTLQYTATGTYSDSITADLTNTVVWASSNIVHATISATGLATGTAPFGGSTVISATLGAVSGNTNLTVVTLLAILVTPINPTIPDGAKKQFTATGIYSNFTARNLTNIAGWASSTADATVTQSGLATATAFGGGSAVISATWQGKTGNSTLTISAATLVSIAVTPINPTIPDATTIQFTATGTYSDASVLDITNAVTWTSSTTDATINAAGLATATAFGGGSSVITATQGAISGNTTLTISAAVLTSIAVTPANPAIPDATTLQFTATGTYSDMSTVNLTNSVTWASSNANATISSTGLATGTSFSGGSAVISATLGAISGNTTLTVVAATLNSITVTPVNPTVPDSTTQQFTATGNYSDSSSHDITTQVTWSSSTSSASISSTGLATATAHFGGSSVITATLGAISGNTTMTVIPSYRFAFIPNSPNIVSRCTINQTTGALSGCVDSGATPLTDPSAIKFTAAATRAYISNFNSDTVSLCNVNISTGVLSGCVDAGATGLNGPNGITLNPAETFAYITNDTGNLVIQCAINPITGLLSGCVNSGATGLDQPESTLFNSAGTIAYISSLGGVSKVTQCTVNTGTGALSACFTSGATGLYEARGLTFNSSGTLIFIANSAPLPSFPSVRICSVNTGTGALSACVDSGGVFQSPTAVALSSSGTTSYVPNFFNGIVNQCTVNPATGAMTLCADSGAAGLVIPLGITLY